MPFSPHEAYSRCLFGAHLGHPLWTPQLKTQLRESYQLEGLKIGDVGVVSSIDGSFDVLFNITLPRNEQPYPRLVGEDFTPIILDPEADFATQDDTVSAHGVISSDSVELISQEIYSCDQTPSRADYEFSLSMDDGAVLALPEGAENCDLANEQRFLDEAIRHGVDWYECATNPKKAGRLINNDSLYLITGFHKARSWSLGAARRNDSGQEKRPPIRFKVGQVHQDNVPARAYLWAATHGFTGRVGPTYPYEIPNHIGDRRLRRGVNQTVFIRGFRITVNKLLFLKTVSVKTRQGTFFGFWTYINNLLWGRTSEFSQSSETEGSTDNTVDQDSPVNQLYMDTRITIDRVPDVSQAFHPGDSINRYLLKKEPHAVVAVTHDRLWIEMLQKGLLKLADFSREKCLQEVLSKDYQVIMGDGAVYLQKGHAFNSPPHGHSFTPDQSHNTSMDPAPEKIVPKKPSLRSFPALTSVGIGPRMHQHSHSHSCSSSQTQGGQYAHPLPIIPTIECSPLSTASIALPSSYLTHSLTHSSSPSRSRTRTRSIPCPHPRSRSGSRSRAHSRTCTHSHLSLSRWHSLPPQVEINVDSTPPREARAGAWFAGRGVDSSDDNLGSISGSLSASSPFGASGASSNISSSPSQQEQNVMSNLKSASTNNFIKKLYHMITDTKSQHFISWTEPGTSFVVSNVGEFSRSMHGSHPKHNNFSSFVRQLSMYGFQKINVTPRAQRISSTPKTWEFSHPKFLRGRPDLLEAIKCQDLEPSPRGRNRVELSDEVACLLSDLREENRALWREVRSLSSRIPQVSPASRDTDWEDEDGPFASMRTGIRLGGNQGEEELGTQNSGCDFGESDGLNVPGAASGTSGPSSGEDWKRWAEGEIIKEKKKVERLVGVVRELLNFTGANAGPDASGDARMSMDREPGRIPSSILQELHELS